MTDREERQHVIEVLKQMRLDYEDFWEENDTEEIKAFNYAIASIETDLKYDLLYEQESNCSEIPTGSTTKDYLGVDYLGVDAISRQAINGYIDYILSHGMGKRKSFEFIKKFVANLPPATPQEPRKGHWIENAPEYQNIDPPYICSECGNMHLRKTNYCDQCGAKMVEPQESEG